MPRTVFNLPQFDLRHDRNGIRDYANVSNLLEVATSDLRVHYVTIEVPTQLFRLMRSVFNVPVECPAFLALDEVRGKHTQHVLSLRYGPDQLVDLWAYTPSTAPKWVFMREYQVEPTEDQLQVLLG